MKRRELYTVLFIILVNSLYFFIVFAIFFSVVGESEWNPKIFSILHSEWGPFTWLAEWADFAWFLQRSELNEFIILCEYPILGASYLYLVGQAALISGALMADYVPSLTPFHYSVLYMGLFNVLFEIITAILTIRLVSRYFGQIYASNIVFIFILLPIVWWVTICRWDMFPIALTVCTLYFAVENKPWYAWISLSLAILVKFYPIILVIPILFYCFERDGIKKTLLYVLSMITLGVLVYIPFILTSRYSTYVILRAISIQSRRSFSHYSIWYWVYLFGEVEKGLLLNISMSIQVGIIFTYILLDYFYERKKENPLSIDKALIKRSSIVILLFLLTYALGGYQYVVLVIPFLIIFINSFKKFFYFIFWIIPLHILTYLTVIIYAYFHLKVDTLYFFLIWMIYFTLYMVAIGLILSNRKLYKNTIPILNERDFMLGLYNFVKKPPKIRG